MSDDAIGIRLHLQSGIPVLALSGEWNESAGHLLREAVSRLTGAGHFEIIVDVTQVRCVTETQKERLAGLESIAGAVRARFGRLGIIGTKEMLAFARKQTHSLARWAATEIEAVCLLKGIPMAVCGARITSRLSS